MSSWVVSAVETAAFLASFARANDSNIWNDCVFRVTATDIIITQVENRKFAR